VTPEQRAANQLFGMQDYVPRHPDRRFLLDTEGGQWITYNDLVAQYRAEEELSK
jgi:hypothetical protein